MQTALMSAAHTAHFKLDPATIERVAVNLPGRLMLATQDEYDCKVIDMSPGDMRVYCTAFPMIGERIVAYVDHIGRLEGIVSKIAEHGFIISLQATDRKREKLAAQLSWFVNRRDHGTAEDRRHERIMPRNASAELMLEDGTTHRCRIIDLSLSGMAVEMDDKPNIGVAVRIGAIRGRVVRHFQEGIAIEFASLQSPETLASLGA